LAIIITITPSSSLNIIYPHSCVAALFHRFVVRGLVVSLFRPFSVSSFPPLRRFFLRFLRSSFYVSSIMISVIVIGDLDWMLSAGSRAFGGPKHDSPTTFGRDIPLSLLLRRLLFVILCSELVAFLLLLLGGSCHDDSMSQANAGRKTSRCRLLHSHAVGAGKRCAGDFFLDIRFPHASWTETPAKAINGSLFEMAEASIATALFVGWEVK
jgi:hypothetical protein